MSKLQSLLYLTGVFIAWKTLLLGIALSAPGVGYDTSTNLLPGTNKLIRWDAIYFVQMAHRGHVFEQEWAFGMGISTLLSKLSDGSLKSICTRGILLAHVTHYIAVVALWHITRIIAKYDKRKDKQDVLPFLACCLHTVAPAGIFLSAPYTEPPFSALNMVGIWLYFEARSGEDHTTAIRQCLLLIVAGFSFGVATVLRSNGVLSGLPLLMDSVGMCFEILTPSRENRQRALGVQVALLASTIVAGLLIAAGFAMPQYLAYQEYCTGVAKQPWCSRSLPLIYNYVQSHYWGVGFLRYWTLSNVPLFLLAVPMLTLLLYSGATSISKASNVSALTDHGRELVTRLALPQMVLASLAITNYHVQIITRLSSGYPWLYIWLAMQIRQGQRRGLAALSVRFFVLYALIQSVLFGSFLPPA